MSIKIFALILTFAVVCVTALSLAAQSRSSLYAAPQRLLLAGDDGEAAEAEKGVLLREHFFPIGWSKDGKFAFYTEPADEACGCYFADLLIVDLRTDKILWQREYESDEHKADTLAAYWRQNQKEFSAKLAQYKIERATGFALRQFPFAYKTDLLTLELTANLKVENEESVTGNITLRLNSRQKGSKTLGKTLYDKRYSSAKYDSIRAAQIGGVLVSPFEPRAAVVLVETHRGYEGPPSVIKLKIIGADLEKSFR